jgi:hypothetical protein
MEEIQQLKIELNETRQRLVMSQMSVLQYQMNELKREEAALNPTQENTPCPPL